MNVLAIVVRSDDIAVSRELNRQTMWRPRPGLSGGDVLERRGAVFDPRGVAALRPRVVDRAAA